MIDDLKDFSPASYPTLESDSLLSSVSLESDRSICTTEFITNLTNSTLSAHSEVVAQSFEDAVASQTSISMLPNFNISPSGNEKGDILVIDLGGSTLRVAVVRINPTENNLSHQHAIIVEKKWTVDNNFKLINQNFFSWIGLKIIETLKEQTVLSPNDKIHMGITWSFPLKQSSHNSGIIAVMGKGYTVSPEIRNKDLKSILEETMLKNHNIHISVDAIVNDSLAVYAAGAFMDKYLKIAIVLGTGFNMCCALNVDRLHISKQLKQQKAVLLNSEISLFGHQLLPDIATKYDTFIDSRIKPNTEIDFEPYFVKDTQQEKLLQPAEFTTSGRYLPELARLMIIEMIDNNQIFRNVPKEQLDHLYTPYDGFSGEIMCFVSENPDYGLIKSKLSDHYGWSNVSDLDSQILVNIVDQVITRAAYVVACMLISTIKLMISHNGNFSESTLKIGYVGSVLEYFHSYRNSILNFINNDDFIRKLNLSIDFKRIDNSSIVGAAVGAAFYSQKE